MAVAEKLRMHVQKIIRLIQRRREPQWGHVLKSLCGRDGCAGIEVENRQWKTSDGEESEVETDRERERERKYEKKEDEKCKLTHARVKNLYRRRVAIV